jgi:TonB family protein
MRGALLFALSLLPAALPAQDTAQLARTGLRAVATGEYTTAVYFLKQVVAAEPRHPSAWKELCRAYLELDRLDAAIDACLKQIDVHPDAPQVYEILGRAYWKKGKRDEAISAGYSGVTPPVVIYKVDAQYSKEASKKKIQGTITVEFLIDPTGHPRNIEVTRGLGYGLDEKAIEAVGKWRFRPGTKEGEPVYTHATSQVTFRLLKDH